MALPPSSTPLYNHPLPALEAWLNQQGCNQDKNNPNVWRVARPSWQAEIVMDIEDIRVRYIQENAGSKEIQRAFPYSLSRQDVEDAIFTGP
ncbi:MAG: DUF3143 domain-containing protein [Pseudanabaenaceae cyanobacterium bins.39]|nr:DUF3143 domain-containing protein [Pseudanabaenaceae cyanobacterium bins.39]